MTSGDGAATVPRVSNERRLQWDQRYGQADYLFGVEPNAFLAGQRHRLAAGQRALAVADGEGRNGVWLAEQGLDVTSVDISPIAVSKAARLAKERGVTIKAEVADLLDWWWPRAAFDVVVAIFIQFATPAERRRLFGLMAASLVPGGLLLLEGYRREQLDYGTGGPGDVRQLYSANQIRAELEGWAGLQIEWLDAYDADLAEGTLHVGRSALIDVVARKRAAP